MGAVSSQKVFCSPEADVRREFPVLLRAAERLLSLVLLILAAPLFAAVLGTVWLLSQRPPLVAHLRIGRFGQPFWMLKLRTMWDAESYMKDCGLVERLQDAYVPENKNADDPRVTHALARFLRQYSIDELPQLIHVIRGQMSLVGPRPLTERELREHYGPAAAEVLEAKPGITGLWQVMGRNELTYPQRRRLDLFLVRHLRPAFYAWILWRTLPVVIRGENSG